MYYSGFDMGPFIFKAFPRAGDALGPICSIWELVLMPRRKACEHHFVPQHLNALLSCLQRLLCVLILAYLALHRQGPSLGFQIEQVIQYTEGRAALPGFGLQDEML